MRHLGYYAKDKDGHLFQFQWGEDDIFYIITIDGKYMANPNDFEILEMHYSISENKYRKRLQN